MTVFANLKRGDSVYCVYHPTTITDTPRGGSYVTVKSVGRKYITVSSGARYQLNGYGEFGWRIYPSHKYYEDLVALTYAWSRFHADYPSYRIPNGLTLEKIERIREILRSP